MNEADNSSQRSILDKKPTTIARKGGSEDLPTFPGGWSIEVIKSKHDITAAILPLTGIQQSNDAIDVPA
jgi:hypothetical protein